MAKTYVCIILHVCILRLLIQAFLMNTFSFWLLFNIQVNNYQSCQDGNGFVGLPKDGLKRIRTEIMHYIGCLSLM